MNLSTPLGGVLSKEDIEKLVMRSTANRSLWNFDIVTQSALTVSFGILIAFGIAGNGLVCYVMWTFPAMRTSRNILILNLALSDLTLCLLVQPLNLLKVSMSDWRLGNALCKLVPMISGTNVFVSTLSITAIALDRFQLIVHPTDRDVMKSWSAVALASIWLLSALLATPMLVFSGTQPFEPYPGVTPYELCIETSDFHYFKLAYSVASIIVQYILPILIVSIAHARISHKLRNRMKIHKPSSSSSAERQPPIDSTPAFHSDPSENRTFFASSAPAVASPCVASKRKLQEARSREVKVNRLLVTIAVIFAASWMPLNVFNLIADLDQEALRAIDRSGLVFALSHLLALVSPCLNPVLYGWLNDNFRQRFIAVLCGSRGSQEGVTGTTCDRGKSVSPGGRSELPLKTTIVSANNEKLHIGLAEQLDVNSPCLQRQQQHLQQQKQQKQRCQEQQKLDCLKQQKFPVKNCCRSEYADKKAATEACAQSLLTSPRHDVMYTSQKCGHNDSDVTSMKDIRNFSLLSSSSNDVTRAGNTNRLQHSTGYDVIDQSHGCRPEPRDLRRESRAFNNCSSGQYLASIPNSHRRLRVIEKRKSSDAEEDLSKEALNN